MPSTRAEKSDERPIFVSVERAKHETGLGRTKIYELIGDRTLDSVTIGRRRLIRFDSLLRLGK
jgi:excisionase family DNA binding protein